MLVQDIVTVLMICVSSVHSLHISREVFGRTGALISSNITESDLIRLRGPSIGHQNPQVSPPIPDISAIESRSATYSNSLNTSFLFSRDANPCSKESECADKSCCSKNGTCGYGADYCSIDNCDSNCEATAMCGKYSEGGTQKCGMNLCCSAYGWCGTSSLHCSTTDNGNAKCQEGFGLCHQVPPPSCSPSQKSTDGRKIGYYQSWNVRNRLCNRVAPSQIITTGYTHLFYSFASVDPHTFSIVAPHPDDVSMMKEFTALKTAQMQTWIAVGGYDFSDPGATRTTWSDLASTSENRSKFIASVKSFLVLYGFQGIDLDWEYPGTPERGGKPQDTANLVLLVKELRASLGSEYGLSLTLAPDYWYLRFFDAKAMEPYVDFFGFMAYDLHGPWDSDVKTLGAKIRGQAEIPEIYNDTMPLWFDGLDPVKINLGLASYGRGYTVSDRSCNSLGCSFKGPSLPGPCTNAEGVLSLQEIEDLIVQKNLTPLLLEKEMMKQITWDNQWIGYDDEETHAMKKAWGDALCFGGTMLWSIDFMSGEGTDAPATKDGLCGPDNGFTVCGNSTFGVCCSASGFCGSTAVHCGNICLSGACTMNGITTDGTCGKAKRGSVCGVWPTGGCCSGSGFCGIEEDFCGDGCQSGPCKNKGIFPALNAYSSCLELEESQDPEGPGKNEWEKVSAMKFYEDWLNTYKGDDLETDFAATPWGLRESFADCGIDGNCGSPNCNDFGNQITREQGAAAYLIMLQMMHINQIFENLNKRLDDLRIFFGDQSTSYQQRFDKNDGDDNSLFTKELLNAIGTAFAVGGAASGPAAGVLGPLGGLINGVLQGLILAMDDEEPQDLQDVAALQDFMKGLFVKSGKMLAAAQSELRKKGKWTGAASLQDFMRDGAYLDKDDWSILSEDVDVTSKIEDLFRRHLTATIVNWAWHRQRVFLVSFPCEEDEFNSVSVAAGDNDPHLKHWYKGQAYYFQSIYPYKDGFGTVPVTQNPPGWDKLTEGITTKAIIESSADGFDSGGFTYNPLRFLVNGGELPTDIDGLADGIFLPGVFTLPHCYWDKTEKYPDLKTFTDYLTAPGHKFPPFEERRGQIVPPHSIFLGRTTIEFCCGAYDDDGLFFPDFIDTMGECD